MRILVSNDDGIDAGGLRALVANIADMGEVVVVAPHEQRSASSHGISIRGKLVAKQVDMGHPHVTAYSLTGTPVDCVKWAVCELSGDRPFDLMLSGINEGRNLASDVLYSGTVAAAGEAALQHIPAVALSLDGPPFAYEEAARAVRLWIDRINWHELGSDVFLNVNLPQHPNPNKWQATTLGTRGYRDYFRRQSDEHGNAYYRYVGEVAEQDDRADVDTEAVRAGYISVTPMRYRFTHDELVEKLRTRQMTQQQSQAGENLHG